MLLFCHGAPTGWFSQTSQNEADKTTSGQDEADKTTSGQDEADKTTRRQADKTTRRQADKRTKRQADKRTKRQADKTTIKPNATSSTTKLSYGKLRATTGGKATSQEEMFSGRVSTSAKQTYTSSNLLTARCNKSTWFIISDAVVWSNAL